MKTVVVYAHPWDKSYNNAILETLKKSLKDAGHTVDIIDLYKENFDPVLSEKELSLYSNGEYMDKQVGEYQKRIEQARHLFFIFPIWWYDVPAILKGFLDRVLLKNWAYDLAPSGLPIGKLTFIEKATIITTLKTPGWYYRLVYGNSLKFNYIKGTFKFCGVKKVKWIKIANIEKIGQDKRAKMLLKISNYAKNL